MGKFEYAIEDVFKSTSFAQNMYIDWLISMTGSFKTGKNI